MSFHDYQLNSNFKMRILYLVVFALLVVLAHLKVVDLDRDYSKPKRAEMGKKAARNRPGYEKERQR